MTKTEYREYVASQDWRRRRDVFVTEHPRCNRCHLGRVWAIKMHDQDLHVHHVNYARIGQELDSDLEVLCAACHEMETFGKTEKIGLVSRKSQDWWEFVMQLGEHYEHKLTDEDCRELDKAFDADEAKGYLEELPRLFFELINTCSKFPSGEDMRSAITRTLGNRREIKKETT